MNKTRDEIINELEDTKPSAALNLYAIETGDKDMGGMALHIDFGEDGPPKGMEDVTTVQLVAILLSREFTKIMNAMNGKEVENFDGMAQSSEEVLSSLIEGATSNMQSEEKDAIDKQLEELGIKPVTNKEVH